MPDENTQNDTGQIDDTQVDDNQTVDDKVDITKQSDGDFMADTIDQIKDTQKIILDDDDSNVSIDDNDGTQDSAVIAELAGHDIPDVFSDAAEAAGMSPSDIVAFADKHTDEQLIEMIPTLEAALKESDDKQDDNKDTKQDDKTDKDDTNKDIDPELVKSISEKISKQLEEKFGTTLKEIDKFKAHQEEQLAQQTANQASKLLDKASKEFPVFGKTDELPRFPSGRLAGQLIPTSPAMKARLEVLGYADAFMSKGANIDDAMANALATYKGLHLEVESQRKAIRDLKNHEINLSGARTGKE
ncbi:MAG: hypothetical protein JRJ62_15605, partial [Deltaproteobacteria bacterium]|nr:hypothetical protein [Deltaproteobacteria bacterium]